MSFFDEMADNKILIRLLEQFANKLESLDFFFFQINMMINIFSMTTVIGKIFIHKHDRTRCLCKDEHDDLACGSVVPCERIRIPYWKSGRAT